MYEYAPDAMIDSLIRGESILYSVISENFRESDTESDVVVHRVLYPIEFIRESIHIIDHRWCWIRVDLENSSLIDRVS